jgi:hypothetical protein
MCCRCDRIMAAESGVFQLDTWHRSQSQQHTRSAPHGDSTATQAFVTHFQPTSATPQRLNGGSRASAGQDSLITKALITKAITFNYMSPSFLLYPSYQIPLHHRGDTGLRQHQT